MYNRIFRCALALLALAGGAALAEERQNIFYSTDDEHEELIATPNASSGSCGVERWSVKTGTDADVGLVNVSSTQSNTIVTMRSWTAPNPIPPNNRVSPYETTDWVINATLTQYKLETDSDYHLVIQDASGNTMIAEIADPACVGTGSPFAAKIQAARAAFDAKYSATTSFQTANIPVQLTGVGMFDFLHGQTGVAPNGIELHPVLNIVFNPGNGNPDFVLSATPGSLSENQGASASTMISVTPSSGFTGNVSFSASGLPSGVTAAFNPTSSSSSTTLALTASSTATTGAATITVTGTSGNLIHTTLVNLTVNAASGGGGQTAVYNSTLKAPGCAMVGSGCDSGPSLLLGRASLSGGAEPNQPNTINSSCADGTSGAFHSDESNDRLAIATTDGSPFAAGKTVKVTATVWAYGTTDALDLYSAANANSPSWVLLSTITPSATGAQTLSTSFTLPAGNLQAIRANFRYQGSASPCSTGSYDDHDDLIFAVAGNAGGTPTANFTFTTSGLTANFTDSSTDSGGTISSHAWTFGDGGTSTAASPSHTYSAAGTYSVTETVTDRVRGNTSSKTSSVSTTAGGTPTANFTFTTSGLTANFTDSSTDSGGTISSHAWTFGDGGTSTATSPSHTYAVAGTYSVTETVTDSFSGRTSSKTASVTVTISAPTQLLGNTGFETGTASPWTITSGVLCTASSCSGESAHGGSWFAWLDGYGSAHTDTVSQSVAITAGKTSATLWYYLHIDTAETGTIAHDTLKVQLYSGTTLLTTLATYSNLNAVTGYAVHTNDVSAYIGQTVVLKFTGTENSSLLTSFVLDDITLTVQ